MFILSKNADEETFWATVTGWAPAKKAGATKVKYEFDVHFRHIRTKDDESAPNDLDWFKERVIGWKRIVDEDKTEIVFNEENLAILYELQWARLPIITAYYKEIDGSRLRSKN
ncbi:hypothetical protein D3093_26895 (plasmid) [Azospirillum argentinense]|uniref:Uncharacterized protein n=1 Tax=Azospirillum argentinense TaxID=2970906 RepID=A0A4D8PU92_9PROT|nr:hypothetical protein [Azospirillum argentinense]QCN98915.1 hypothetical protein D3093_26895 [Azospirillum argentinense]